MTDTNPTIISGNRNIRVRGLLVLLMAIAYHISGMLLALGAIVQFVLAVLSDGPNARLLAFGRSLGRYVGQIADFEPTYIDWLAKTISRDPDLVAAARAIQADLDQRGIFRQPRPIVT